MSKSSNRKSVRRHSQSKLGYESLESRAMLAPVIAFEPLLGTLDIGLMSENDSVTIGIDPQGDVTVNGSNDLNTAMLGVQTANYHDVMVMDIHGDPLRSGQSVNLTGDFSNSVGGALQDVFVTTVRSLELGGSFDLSGNLFVTLNDSGGGVIQSSGRVHVAGRTTVMASENPILLDSSANDFVGAVTLEASGENAVTISDSNDIMLHNIDVGQNFKLASGGTVSGTLLSRINIGEDGVFGANKLSLGNSATDSLVMTRALFTVDNHAEFFFDDVAVLVGDSSAGSLHVESTHGIFDGRNSSINVDGKASFVAANIIRIGEHGTDTFNSGELTFQAGTHASISANSDMMIVGDNFARSADLFSEGDMRNDENSRINIATVFGVEGRNVILGDADSDQFNSGALSFYAEEDVFISEDSDIHVIDAKNYATNMTLQSSGHISDSLNSWMMIEDVARFEANTVVIGESLSDRFNAGWISYATEGRFLLFEDSSTSFIGVNDAGSIRIDSAAHLTNAHNTTIRSKMVAELSASSIKLGFKPGDQVEFGSMMLNSKGAVAINEDGGSILTGDSNVDSLQLISTETILDSFESKLNVNRVASFRAPGGITIGDQVSDEFNSTSLVVKSDGHVRVTQDSEMFLAGENFAKSLSLTADGNIFDSHDVEIHVEHLLKLTGDIINLGTSEFDNVKTGSISLKSTSNANIAVNSDVTFAGQSTVGNTLLLKSDGDITDSEDSKLMVERSAVFTAIDVIIGDTDTDCFDLNLGDVFANVTGIKDITRGC